MTVLRDVSQLWALIHVLVVFLLLFESRRPWRATVVICFSSAAAMTIVTFAAAALGQNPVGISFFTCSLPSMALFFWLSQHRNGRFFFLFCLSDTMCIWLLQVTNLLDRLAGGGYVVMFVSRLVLFPLAEWFIWKRVRPSYQELQRLSLIHI